MKPTATKWNVHKLANRSVFLSCFSAAFWWRSFSLHASHRTAKWYVHWCCHKRPRQTRRSCICVVFKSAFEAWTKSTWVWPRMTLILHRAQDSTSYFQMMRKQRRGLRRSAKITKAANTNRQNRIQQSDARDIALARVARSTDERGKRRLRTTGTQNNATGQLRLRS